MMVFYLSIEFAGFFFFFPLQCSDTTGHCMPQKMCLKQKAIKIKYKRMLQEIKMSYLLSIHEDSGGELHPPEGGELA